MNTPQLFVIISNVVDIVYNIKEQSIQHGTMLFGPFDSQRPSN